MKSLYLTLVALILSVASFALTPITGVTSICTGTTSTLMDSTAGGVWNSSNTAVATIGVTTGIVTGVSAGTSLISYTAAGTTVTTVVTVNISPAAITGSSSVCVGASITLADVTPGGIWSSSNLAIATVGAATGVVSALSAGSVNITYTLPSGCYAVKTITVNYMSAIYGSHSVCVGSTTTLTDSTTGGFWTSSATAIANVGTNGIVTGLATGVATISYTSSTGCYAIYSVTVSPAVAAITGASTVCVGSTITLTDATSGGSWLSGNTTIASAGSLTGIVTGLSAGVVSIYYSVGGCATFKTVTVTAGTATITGGSSVCVGSTLALTGSGGGIWSSSNTAIASVGTTGVVTGGSAGTATIYYTVSGCAATKVVTVLAALPAITGLNHVCVGSSTTLADAVGGGTWSSSNTSVAAIISTTGLMTGLSAGAATITYTLGGCYAIMSVTVFPVPSPISGPSSVCVGSSITLTDATTGGLWSSSNTSVATANSASGIVTGVAPGVATITYSASTCSATYTVTVTTSTVSISGPSSVCVGSTITLTAAGGGTWSSGNTSIETVGASTGIVTGVSVGTTNIYYTVSGCAAYKTVNVISALPAISGPSGMCVGASITLSDSVTGGTWLSGNTSIATVGSTTGVVTSLTTGVVNIYYSTGGCAAFRTVTVSPSPAGISGASSVCVGSTTTFTDATPGGVWSSGNIYIATVGATTGSVTGVALGATNISYTVGGCSVYRSISATSGTTAITGSSSVCIGTTITLTAAGGGTWTSGNTSIATVSSAGVVTGIAAGTVNIYYTISGCSSYKTITVTSGSVIYGPSTLCTGSTITLMDSLAGGTWLSGNTSIATVGATSGVVTPVTTGVVNIYYSAGGCSASKTLTITAGPAAITGASSVCIASSTTLADVTAGGAWSSASSAIASVNSAGVVTGMSVGATTISYTVGGCSATWSFTVNPIPVSITGPTTVCVGATITLSDATAGGVWMSGNTSIATITTSGIVTGVGAGVVNIYYSFGSCGTYRTVTVNPAPAAIGGPSVVCVGRTITLTDAVAGGRWSSSAVTVASIGTSTGILSGLGAGVTVVSYTISTGCSATKTITVSANPTVSSIVGASSVIIGFNTTLTDATPGGVWSSSNSTIATVGSTGIVHGVRSGSFNILYTVTNSAGCVAYTLKAMTCGPTPPAHGSGLMVNGENATIENVTILPNPNNGEFTLNATCGVETTEVSIEVSNMLGQVIYSNSITANNGAINEHIVLGTNLANGMYLLNLRSNMGNQVIRFVVEK